MSGFMSMFSSDPGKYGKDTKGGSDPKEDGFMSNYGGAIAGGLSSMFADRAARRAADKQAKLTKEQAALNRKYQVEDTEYERKNYLADKDYRQKLLNPYAAYSRGS